MPISKIYNQIKFRVRLRRICRVLKIEPYEWQKQFAIDGEAVFSQGRRTGKTMAVIFRALVQQPKDAKQLYDIMSCDPDFHKGRWIQMVEYEDLRHYYEECVRAGIIKTKVVSRQQLTQEIEKEKKDAERSRSGFHRL